MNFLDGFSKNQQVSNFLEFRSMETELFRADRRDDEHDEANSRYSQFCENAKNYLPPPPPPLS
jgi:hypothetical protein